jgi:hypothetical protein
MTSENVLSELVEYHMAAQERVRMREKLRQGEKETRKARKWLTRLEKYLEPTGKDTQEEMKGG